MIVLVAVWAVMVVLPVGVVWWSCRVAPSVKRRGVTIADLMETVAEWWPAYRSTLDRARRTLEVTRDDIAQLRAAWERKP